ncbi:MAG: hypothetical protein JXJ17_11705 [Anaerolineae bacterium]|nr:hypothetical protein [Anaerolineae bacterium]
MTSEDLQRQMASLSKYVGELEQRLGDTAGELAELTYLMEPFLVLYQQQVLPYHEQLAAVQRDIADARALLGDEKARSGGQADTPLSRLVATEDWVSVQEQYERVWMGKKHVRPDSKLAEKNLEPASPEVKNLFREIVAKIHPELATKPSERIRRNQILEKVNEAYARRDIKTLQAVADAFRDRSNLPAVISEQTLKHLHNQALLLEWVTVQLEGQVFELRHGEIAKMHVYTRQADEEGYDLLGELSQQLKQELREAQRTLSSLQAQL